MLNQGSNQSSLSSTQAGKSIFVGKEFDMKEGHFQQVQKLAYDICGIHLSDAKKEMVYGRLAKRLRALSLDNFDDYFRLLENNLNDEETNFINSITTNLTFFFRENHHFDYLQNEVAMQLRNWHKMDKKIRIWSAGCSTGEEPYSLSMAMQEVFGTDAWDYKILATDLDSNVVAEAKAGAYDSDRIKDIDNSRKKKFFKHSPDGSKVHIKESVQSNISFKQLNLMHKWPMKGPFDVVFCRNVVIYFDKPTQKKLFNRYADLMRMGGYLFIGHSENISGISDRFEPLGKTIYRKIK